MQKVSTGYLTGTVASDHTRTAPGRDQIKLGNIPSMTLLTLEISGPAEVVIEYSEDELVYIPVASVTVTSGVQFAVPASILAVNTISLGGGYVRVMYRTVTMDNIPSQTLIVYGAGTVSSPVLQGTSSHSALTGLDADDHTQYVLRSILINDGDMFIRNAGVITRLGIGTVGQVLTVSAGGLPEWA